MPRNCWTRCNKTFPCSFPAREKTREIESRETSKRLEKQAILALLRKMIYKFRFTKVSFAKKAEISRPTLDKILNGSIDNKSTFDKHLQKVLAVLNISVDDLVFFEAKPKSDIVDVVYSENAPKDYKISDKAQKQYGLLMDILELCDIYY